MNIGNKNINIGNKRAIQSPHYINIVAYIYVFVAYIYVIYFRVQYVSETHR